MQMTSDANDTLAKIERQLTQAAEMQLAGSLSEELYSAVIRGALAMLPYLETPRHIVVLKALKRWRDNELLPVQQCERLQADVVAVSLPPLVALGECARPC